MNRIAAVLVIAALASLSAAQPRLAPPLKDLPRTKPVQARPADIEPPPVLNAPPETLVASYENAVYCAKEYRRLLTLYMAKPREHNIFECRPSTAWLVCAAKDEAEWNATARFDLLSDIESHMKVCKSNGL